MSAEGFQITIPAAVEQKLREEILSGRMSFAQFDRRLAEELGYTAPVPLIKFLYEIYCEED